MPEAGFRKDYSRCVPVDLVGYDWLEKLEEWRNGDKDSRQWRVFPTKLNDRCWAYSCEMRWRTGDGEAHLLRLAKSIEEAVWLALFGFDRWMIRMRIAQIRNDNEHRNQPTGELGEAH
jgi:hypothetical protein